MILVPYFRVVLDTAIIRKIICPNQSFIVFFGFKKRILKSYTHKYVYSIYIHQNEKMLENFVEVPDEE